MIPVKVFIDILDTLENNMKSLNRISNFSIYIMILLIIINY